MLDLKTLTVRNCLVGFAYLWIGLLCAIAVGASLALFLMILIKEPEFIAFSVLTSGSVGILCWNTMYPSNKR